MFGQKKTKIQFGKKQKREFALKKKKEKGTGNIYNKQIILIKALFLIMGKEF